MRTYSLFAKPVECTSKGILLFRKIKRPEDPANQSVNSRPSIMAHEMDKSPLMDTVSANLSDPEIYCACRLALAT
ncbi:hypothetical protein MMC29_007483 [Sticta canariensis]|nr:hypothetical protein [Sticta canariensis]